ncbi:MAG: amidohydrolase [Anaerolineae bacterium]|nr:amidohydrolase [Anaerolineae bacterium]
MQPADKLILHGLVVTMDDQLTLIDDGAVAIVGAKITAVGATNEVSGFIGPTTEIIDATGQLVMPGLINAHTHAADALFRGLVDDLALEPWLERLWVAERKFLRPDTVRLGAQLAQVEMIRSGTTTALDMFWFPEVSAQVAKDAGFRLMTGPVYFDLVEPDNIPVEQRTARGREFLQEYQRDQLIVSCVTPHSTYTVSPQYLREAQALADEFGVLLTTHVSETTTEVATVSQRYGQSPPRHLDQLGMLTSRTVLAHCVHLPDDEINLLAERQTAVAHCPMSNLKLGSGVAPLPKMRQSGVQTTLGTDGPVSSNDLDMWAAMRLAAVLHKGVQQNPTLLSAQEVVKMVTCDAAGALGLSDKIGSLVAGKEADIILIDLNRPHLVPRYDVYSHLVYAVGRDDVATVLIRGRMVMQQRRLLTIDQTSAIAAVQELAQQIASC